MLVSSEVLNDSKLVDTTPNFRRHHAHSASDGPASHTARWSVLGGRIPTTAAPNNAVRLALRDFLCIGAGDGENAITSLPAGVEPRQHQDLEVGLAERPNGIADGDEFHDR